MRTNSSGRLDGTVELVAGDTGVRIDLDHGARLASLRVGGRELLLGPPAPPDGSIRWGCFLMAPWAGRLADGRLRWRDATIQVPRTHGRHAIHGLVHGAAWRLDDVRDSADGHVVETSVELGPLGWPFGGRVRQRISLAPSRLVLRVEVEADEPMPVALGWHPWFIRRGFDPTLRLAADRVLETRGMIPTGSTLPVGGSADLRGGPRLGRRRLDTAYVAARGPATIAWPDLVVDLEFSPPVSTVVVHTPPVAFCVEPQTAWPNALGSPRRAARSGRGLDGERPLELSAGQRLTAELTFEWTELGRIR
jgi:galactose mutarotase-like enzyme